MGDPSFTSALGRQLKEWRARLEWPGGRHTNRRSNKESSGWRTSFSRQWPREVRRFRHQDSDGSEFGSCDRKEIVVMRNTLILISSFCLLLVSCAVVPAQMGQRQGGSPLYSSKPYEPSAPNGLPSVLKEVGIDQKLNQPLPGDAIFKDENGNEVKLESYF